MATKELQYVETEGGPFVLLPLELKKSWKGIDEDESNEDDDDEDDDDEDDDDDDGGGEFLSTVGTLDVGSGQVLILGTAEVTTFYPTDDGGVFVQRVGTEDDDEVIAAVDDALEGDAWEKSPIVFDAGKGKLALFDAGYEYDDADEDEILEVKLAPGKYAVETGKADTDEAELGFIRLKRI